MKYFFFQHKRFERIYYKLCIYLRCIQTFELTKMLKLKRRGGGKQLKIMCIFSVSGFGASRCGERIILLLTYLVRRYIFSEYKIVVAFDVLCRKTKF